MLRDLSLIHRPASMYPERTRTTQWGNQILSSHHLEQTLAYSVPFCSTPSLWNFVVSNLSSNYSLKVKVLLCALTNLVGVPGSVDKVFVGRWWLLWFHGKGFAKFLQTYIVTFIHASYSSLRKMYWVLASWHWSIWVIDSPSVCDLGASVSQAKNLQ